MEFDFNIDPVFPNRVTVLTPPILKRLIKRDSDLKEKYKLVIDRLGQSSAEAQCLPSVITLFNKFLIADPACHLFVLREGEARGEGEESHGGDAEGTTEVLFAESNRDDVNDGVHGGVNDGVKDGVTQEASNVTDNFSETESTREAVVTEDIPTKGLILGFLKVGPKDLFLHNEVEELVKVKPLCVLDFYVSENCQRRGCGKAIFDFMLDYLNRDEGSDGGGGSEGGRAGGGDGVDVYHHHLKPSHLAYDRPSNKLLPFLNKHYNLSQAVPQFNKFFISTGFFDSDNPCWRNNKINKNNNNHIDYSYGGMNDRHVNRPIPHSKSGGSFFPYSGRNGGAGGRSAGGRGVRNEGEAGGIVSPEATSSSRDPIRRRWFSEDSVSEGQSRQFGERSRPMSDVTSLASEQRNILGG